MSGTSSQLTLHQKVRDTVHCLQQQTVEKVDVGVSLGSGFGYCRDLLNPDTRIFFPYSQISHAPMVRMRQKEGTFEEGGLWVGQMGEHRVALLHGRASTARGFTHGETLHMVRVLAMLGMQRLVVLTAAGGVGANHKPGMLAVVQDHILAPGISPLDDSDDTDPFGSQRVDMCNAYDSRLREVASNVAKHHLPELHVVSGVYYNTGVPHFETGAEIRRARDAGGDLVGRAGVPDVMAARQQNIPCVMLACITNLGAGRAPDRITPDAIDSKIQQAREAVLPTLEVLVTHPLNR